MQAEKLQIGVIVKDLEYAIAKAEELFEITPWRTLEVEEAGVRAAVADWAGVEIELIAGATDEVRAGHEKMLGKKAAKFTHIGAYVKDKDAETARLEKLGVPVVYRDTGNDEMRTSMVDVRNEAGYMLELLQRIK